MTKRGVSGKRLQEGKAEAHRIEHLDGSLWIGHPHVHVKPGHRRGHSVAKQVMDPLVALLVRDLRLILRRGRMGPRPKQPDACAEGRGTPMRQLLDDLAGPRADVADELDHPSM